MSLAASTVALDPVLCVAQEYSPEDLARLVGACPQATIVPVAENLGYASATNLGVRRAIETGAEWVLLVNNDATVDPECVERCLAEALRMPRTAVVGPAVAYRNRPERLWYAGARLHRTLGIVWHEGFRAPRSTPPPSADTDYVPGCCALVSCAAWRDVGPLRADYFMYFEDAEWGERARAAGWRIRYLGEVLCEHEVGASSGTGGSRYLSANAAYYLARNPVRFARETRPPWLRASRTFGCVVVWTAYNATRVRPAEWGTVGHALVTGLRDGWTGQMGARPAARATRGSPTPAAPSRVDTPAPPSTTSGDPGSDVGARDLAGVRACIVYDCLYPATAGGAERWYRALAERLAADGARVTHLTRRQWSDHPPEIPGVDVVAVTGPSELYHADGTRRAGPPVRFGWGVLWWLLRHRRDVDTVQVANFPYFSLLAARAALAGTSVPVYVDWLEIWPLRFWRSYVGRAAGTVGFAVQRLCVALTPHAFVFLGENALRLRRHGLRGEITVLAGLLPRTPPGPRRASSRTGPPVALFFGRHVKDKGVRLVPGVLSEARRIVPDLRLVVAGDGPERPLVESELRRLGLSEHARLTGTVDDEELAALVSGASCTVVPSSREGYGLVVVESCAHGTPVVVAANPENLAVEHVVDGVNGVVVDADPAAIAEGIARVVAAGDALRASTLEWHRVASRSASVDISTAQVASVYAADRRARVEGAVPGAR